MNLVDNKPLKISCLNSRPPNRGSSFNYRTIVLPTPRYSPSTPRLSPCSITLLVDEIGRSSCINLVACHPTTNIDPLHTIKPAYRIDVNRHKRATIKRKGASKKWLIPPARHCQI